MTEREANRDVPLSRDDLDSQRAERLEDREEMSLLNANLAAPVNAAVALNAASDGSTAVANADQDVEIDQSN